MVVEGISNVWCEVYEEWIWNEPGMNMEWIWNYGSTTLDIWATTLTVIEGLLAAGQGQLSLWLGCRVQKAEGKR